jgi:hypothetical protein
VRFSLSITAIVCLTTSAGAEVERSQSGSFPLHVERVVAVGLHSELGSLVGAAMDTQGNLYGVDHLNARIVSFDSEGRERWSVGRRGRGPGEYNLPYRVTAGPDGSVYVFDLGTREISRLSAGGEFVERSRLPFAFSQVDAIAAVAGGTLLLAGYAPEAPHRGARTRAVHRFAWRTPALVHQSSFGPLPRARDPDVLRYWGAGSIHLASDGGVWYGRRSPYEVYRFDPRGRRSALLTPGFASIGVPDDIIQIDRDATGETISTNKATVVYPSTMVELGDGRLLVARVAGENRWWDLYDARGRRVASRAVPREWGALVGYDAARRRLWTAGSFEDRPAFLQITVVPRSSPSPRRSQ